MKKFLLISLVVFMLFFCTSQAKLVEAMGGTVTTDQSQYTVPIGGSTMVQISGNVNSPSGGHVVLTMTKPDGSSETFNADVTGLGAYTTPYLLDSTSELGQYSITASYQGVNFGSVTFSVISQSAASSNVQSRPSQAPSVPTESIGTPAITSVSNIISNPNQVITITGSGFGTQSSYTNEDSQYIQITDNTGNWNAGYKSNLVTLDVARWSDNQISVTGFSGSYGSGNWILHYGDTIYVYVWNPQTGKGPATYTTTVSMDTTTTPTVNLSPSTVHGMTVTINGNWNYPNRVNKVTVDWGDNSGVSTITDQSQYTHTYSHFGTYTETVTVYDINGLSGSATTTVNLQQPPPPSISNLSTTANGMTVQLFGNVNPSPGVTITHTTINWGDGNVTPNGMVSYTHTYASTGTYTITLTAFDSSGQSSSATTSVTVSPVPSVSPSNQPQTNPNTLQNNNPPLQQNPNPSTNSIQNAPQSQPPYVFNGAYANYQIVYTYAGNSASIPLSYTISQVDNSSQTFTFSASYGGTLSVLSMLSVTGTFANPSSFPGVNVDDLKILNQGNVPTDMQGATVTKDVSISVPAGTFNTDEISQNGGSKWVDTSSGLVIKQSGSFFGAYIPSVSTTMQLEKTNIPTNSSPFGSMTFLIVIPIAAAVGVFVFIKKRKSNTSLEVKESKIYEGPIKKNEPEPKEVKESPKTMSPANIEKIEKLKKLLDAGLITQEDFAEKKKKLLE